MSAAASLRSIEENLRYLLDIASAQRVATEPDLDRLLEAYLETRRALARDFRALAVSISPNAAYELELVKSEIGKRLQQMFGALVPDRLLRVRGYRSVHAELLSYLSRRVGAPVMASKLRVLVGDQIHTERRVRELSNSGFAISWRKVAAEDQYVLAKASPDLDFGARRRSP